jgi:hypothetical protein
MVWSAVADSVGLVNGSFQRHRTGAFDRLQAPNLNAEPVTPNRGLLVHNYEEAGAAVSIPKQ